MILILMSSKNIKKNNDNLVNKLNNLSINHRYKIKSLNLVSSWSFITPKNSNCPICHQNLNTNSLSAKEKGIHSYVVEGKCGHCYHNECIEKWTTKYSKNCPLCQKKWIKIIKKQEVAGKTAEGVAFRI